MDGYTFDNLLRYNTISYNGWYFIVMEKVNKNKYRIADTRWYGKYTYLTRRNCKDYQLV